uniref:Uncharacterized protein n=2 Tax=Picea TaxID=3328 RepID=A0A101LXX5_PICGL|nr:hypothetical protein ABT39_MTgene5549 [Picea glauca]QHR91662.1 hypothetical protein Q903MT_gene5698 [Picea sitchensis]
MDHPSILGSTPFAFTFAGETDFKSTHFRITYVDGSFGVALSTLLALRLLGLDRWMGYPTS